MSKKVVEYPILLPPLQLKIVLNLAEFGSQTINQITKNLKSQYKATYIAFESLKRKGIIQEIGKKEYRNREFPIYWLSNEGLIIALINNANPDLIKKYAKEYYGNNEIYDLLSDLAKTLSKETIAYIYTMFKVTEEGKLLFKPIPINNHEVEAFLKTILKYPSIQPMIGSTLEKIEKIINEIANNKNLPINKNLLDFFKRNKK
jgi:hypothetical protein